MTVNEWKVKYLWSKKVHGYRNMASLRSVLGRFCRTFGGAALEGFPRALIAEHADQLLASGLSKTSVSTHLGFLQAFFAEAVALGYAHENPVKGLKRPQRQPRKRFASHAEFARLLASAPPALRPALLLLLYTCCRCGELLALRRADVLPDFGPDAPLGVLRLLNTKTEDEAFIPLSREARAVVDGLLALPGELENSLLGLTYRALYHGFCAARAAANLPDLHIHDLRRTGPNWLYRAGASTASIQAATRHKSLWVLEKHYLLQDLKVRAAALSGITLEKISRGEEKNSCVPVAAAIC